MNTKLLLTLIMLAYANLNGQSILITEVMADVDPNLPEPEGEWIEFYNNSEDTIDLLGWSFRDAADNIVIIDENLEIAPYEAKVIANDSSYSHVESYFQYGKKGNKGNISLNNGAEYLVLNNGTEDVLTFQYDDGDYYGDGFSLELRTIEEAQDGVISQEEMRNGGEGGSPNNYIPSIDDGSDVPLIIITEILADAIPEMPEPESEWIELFNTSSEPVNVRAYYLRDAAMNQFTIDKDLIIPPMSARVLSNDSLLSNVLSYFEYGKKGNKGNIAMNNGSEFVILNDGIDDIFVFSYTDGTYFGEGMTMELKQLSMVEDGIASFDELVSPGMGGTPNFYSELLPVKLKSFDIINDRESITLEWESEIEINSDYYEISYTLDKTEYRTIGTIDAKGTTYKSTEYSFEFEPHQRGVYTFKLAQYDFDGAYEVLGFRSTAFMKNGKENYQVFHRGGNQFDFINSNNHVPLDVKITSIDGKVVRAFRIEPSSEKQINLSNLGVGQFLSAFTINGQYVGVKKINIFR